MLHRKIEALERRLAKMMSKNEAYKKRFEQPYKFAKAALDASAEGNHQSAYENISRFNSLMAEYKLNSNV